ncbi:MAG: MaoC family dehydratase [Chloroflexi bacterium]|nr:MAG: MaoC family dehydratase [Chloroflexota bacterium]
MAIRLDVGAGRDHLRGLFRDPAQHHRRARTGAPARQMSTTAWVIDRLKSRIGVDGPEVTAPVEAGHVRRFAEAIGEYFAPVLIGDQITAKGRVVDVYDKAGSTGNMLFILFETDYTNQHGELVARLRGTMIRR